MRITESDCIPFVMYVYPFMFNRLTVRLSLQRSSNHIAFSLESPHILIIERPGGGASVSITDLLKQAPGFRPVLSLSGLLELRKLTCSQDMHYLYHKAHRSLETAVKIYIT